MRRTFLVVGAVFFLGIVIIGYILLLREPESRPETSEYPSFSTIVAVRSPTQAPASVAARPPTQTLTIARAEPVALHLSDTAPVPEPLPKLSNGDALLLEALGNVLAPKWLVLIVSDELVRCIVATVDQLPRKSLPALVVPLKRAEGIFKTAWDGEELSIHSKNSARYDVYVRLIQSVDIEKLGSVYRKFYPWLQHTYEELGYPKANFNDRLVEAIDDLLAAPQFVELPRLIQPKILYEFADPNLQERSAGQKIMIRIGKENAEQIKAKLNEIRRQVILAPGTK